MRGEGKGRATKSIGGIATSLAVLALAWIGLPYQGRAADNPTDGAFVTEIQDVRKIVVTVNKSRTFRVGRPFTTVVVGSPDIADVRSLSDRVIYVLGKKIGTTNVSVFDENARMIGILDVDVSVDTANVQQKIQASTGTSGIRVSSVQGQVILSGTAVDAVAAERAVSVAKGLAEGGVVVNAMHIAPPQQVLLEVRFLEVSRDAGRELGVNLFGGNASGSRGINTGLGPTGPDSALLGAGRTRANPNGTPVVDQNGNPVQTPGGLPLIGTAGTLLSAQVPFGNILTNILKLNNGTTLDALITALETKGVVRRLAEPNLVALSGDAARFLAGGEFPVPVASSVVAGALPTITIEFKKFGVELAFVPTVLSRGVVNLRIEPSVSELDFANAITIAGTSIPALTKRDARTTVELRDGQSFAIAGLLQTRSSQSIAQLPWIGSVPVLGALFRSSAYLQNETDLVIIVTPRLVAPMVPGQRVASPLESRLPGNDVDFFINGQPEVRKRYNDFVTTGGNLKGPYGHMIVPEPPQTVIQSRN